MIESAVSPKTKHTNISRKDKEVMWYDFSEGVYLVKGVTASVLCDTRDGNIYWLNPVATQVVENQEHESDFWSQLVNAGLANPTESKPVYAIVPKAEPPTLKFIWFEVTSSDCNESCVHCYADSMPPTKRKALGLPLLPDTSRKLTYSEWIHMISEGYELGARRGQFIGGEPLLFNDSGKNCLDLAEHARSVGYEFIEIYTNATMLTREKVSRIKSLGLNVAVSLYSDDPSIHDQITQTEGSHAKTMASLKMLQEAEVSTRVEVVLMRLNEHTLQPTFELIEDMGFRHKHPDPLRPKGRGDNIALFPSKEAVAEHGIMTSPNFVARKGTMIHYGSSHSCLAGKITITEAGDVLPCIFSRNQKMGNVLEQGSLETVILGDALQRVWNTTKNTVLVCRDCEYRLVCFDCRPLSEGFASGQSDYLHAPYPRCSYNPYTNEWAQGVWRMKEGEPFYDRSIAPTLQKVMTLKRADAVLEEH